VSEVSRAYVLGLCDEVLGLPGEHRADLGVEAIDGVWGPLGLAVRVAEGWHEPLGDLAWAASDAGLSFVVLQLALFSGRRADDLEVVRSAIGTEAARGDSAYMLDPAWEGFAAADELDDEGWPSPPERLADDPVAPSADDVALGWRGRSLGLALLGALRLARSGVEHPSLSPRAVEVLVALVNAGPAAGGGSPPADDLGAGVGTLGPVLGLPVPAVTEALAELRRAGLAERTSHPLDSPASFAATPDGLAAVLDLLERLSSWFGAWPPDEPALG